ncbi:hypothetical protein RHGRI_026029 [Rhododendron griersonianum]|uniref:DUF7794 domain-containing protein n=1 Tax=Rhododendron griersonianum TaxID=479676 RepID=A0AAV6IXD7_9ERIC|nr:hypothetical protein RHGRI_026029 [Rhododendron griersonianum]
MHVLQEGYGTEGVTQQGVELLFTSVAKIFDSLQSVYEGQFSTSGKNVGVILSNETPSQESETVLNVMFTSQPSARWLEETTGLPNSKDVAEVLLVWRTLAWVIGIVLLVATIMGVSCLSNPVNLVFPLVRLGTGLDGLWIYLSFRIMTQLKMRLIMMTTVK